MGCEDDQANCCKVPNIEAAELASAKWRCRIRDRAKTPRARPKALRGQPRAAGGDLGADRAGRDASTARLHHAEVRGEWKPSLGWGWLRNRSGQGSPCEMAFPRNGFPRISPQK